MSDNISYELQQIQSTLAALTDRLAASTATQVGGMQMYIAVGWSPIIALTDDGTYYYAQILDWTGGSGIKPPVMQYLCETGWTYNVAEAARVGIVGGGLPDGDKGDITVASGVWTIDNGVVTEVKLGARSVTAAKLFAVSHEKLIGRHGAGSGDAQEIGIDGGLEFNGANIRRAALTGDVTASAGSNTTTLANSGVTAATYGSATTIPELVIDAKGRVTSASSVAPSFVPKQRYRSLWIGAGAMTPATTSGAAPATIETATNDVAYDVYKFDGATAESVWFNLRMPDEWDLGTVKAIFYWEPDTGGSGAVTWGLAGVATSNDDALDSAPGTEVLVSDSVIAVGDLHITSATAAVTIGGSPALGDLIAFRVRRVPSDAGDTMTQDACLLGVAIQWREGTTEPVAW